ncbi:RNA-directed DNA polymerase, eukaryota, partial [Tanacetum coccineum]
MNCLSLNIQGLGSKAKKEWIRELNIKHKVSFLTLQETKIENISVMDVKFLWGNYIFEHLYSEAIGTSGGILCMWDPNVFHKEHHSISDNFVALYGTWNPTKAKILVISIYAPQAITKKRSLWNYITSLITRWDGECIVMGDFNEVRSVEERMGSVYNAHGANAFNDFISNSGLVDVPLEGYSFTLSHPSANKMSKLDRFLVTEGLISLFPHISALCLDRHLSDHRPILLRDVTTNYGAIPFRLYHSWLSWCGFDQMVTHTWNSIVLDDRNGMVRLKKKLQILKKEIRVWVMDQKRKQLGRIGEIKSKLSDIDKQLDQGGVNDDILLSRMDLMKQMQDHKLFDARDNMQSWKIIKLENPITRDEIRKAVWGCGENKSPRPDGFTFDFFRKFWNIIGSDFCAAVEWFFDHSSFTRGCNSSFVSLIPKVQDPKFVYDYWPISLIGSLYK